MAESWRIVKERYAAIAFTGEGAAENGGRWNSRGVAVVYTSGSRSLAALETLVHLNPPVHFKYVVIRVTFDGALVETITPKSLPPDWRLEPPPHSCKRVGDTWVREARSALLAIPSIIIPGELNYLMNPAHLDFKRISIGKPRSFTFDPLLLS
jgi:RES domain-containing protein